MRCPRDLTSLKNENRQALEIHTCRTCRGLWVGLDHLQRRLPRESAQPAAKPDAASAKNSKMWCPQCRRRPLTVKTLQGVEVDVCHECKAMWLDAGELEAIVNWHRNLKRAAPVALAVTAAAAVVPPPKEKESFASDLIDGALELMGDVDVLADLASSIGEVFGKTPELAAEAASALLEFLVEASIDIF